MIHDKTYPFRFVCFFFVVAEMLEGVHPIWFAARRFLSIQEVRNLGILDKVHIKAATGFPSALCVVHGSCVEQDLYIKQLLRQCAFSMHVEELQFDSLRLFLDTVFPAFLRTFYELHMDEGEKIMEDSEGKVFVKQVHRYLRRGIGPMFRYSWWESEMDLEECSCEISIENQYTTCQWRLGKQDLHYLQIREEPQDLTGEFQGLYFEVSLFNLGIQFTIDGLRDFVACDKVFMGGGDLFPALSLNMLDVMRLQDAHTVAIEEATEEDEDVLFCRLHM